MIDEKSKAQCTGCSACVFSCPKQCIKMKPDNRGFLYPEVDHTKCIRCGKCDAVCDRTGIKVNKEYDLSAYGGYALDDDVHINSSSGGFFSVLAQSFLNEGGVVIGAAMSGDCYSVQHIISRSKKELLRLSGSKYLQSDLGDTFVRIRELLNDDVRVLFSGTPCQAAGLKAFLEREYDSLLCIDFICHGVPSPEVWKKYCEEVEEQENGKVVSVNFRDKTHCWIDFGDYIETDNGHSIFHSKLEDPYLRLFLNNYSLRPSCFECKHKGINRITDITIADFWGVRNVSQDLYDKRGVSLAIVQNDRGFDYINRISNKLRIEKIDVIKALDNNKAGIRSASKPDNIEDYWKDFPNLTIDQLANRYCPISVKSQLKLFALNSPFRKLLKNY